MDAMTRASHTSWRAGEILSLRPRGTLARAGFATGALVALALLVSGAYGQEPLPALGWAAVFLALAAASDVERRRIPNALTFPVLLLGVLLAALGSGGVALGASLLGVGVGFALLLLPYAVGALGAGDVKAAMALGALVGAGPVVGAVSWALGLGGLFALGLLAFRGGLTDLGERWSRSVALSLAAGRPHYLPPAPGSLAAGGIPFALALGLGAAGHQIWGTPWV
jgi:Flp pilus assembly protein protease CpaA